MSISFLILCSLSDLLFKIFCPVVAPPHEVQCD